MRILVVEDDSVLAAALTRALNQSAYAVDLVADGEAANDALATTAYDLVVLDIALPKVDGLAVLRRLRDRRLQTPVLILPDDIPAHPYAVAMEAAMLAPKAEVSIYPWKQPKERVPLAVRQIRSFLKAHRPATA